MNSYLVAMRNYAVFEGRAARSEFWCFFLFATLFSMAASLIDAVAVTPRVLGFGVLWWLVNLIHWLPSIAVGVRRLHDIGRTGWWMLLGLTIIGHLLLFVFYCLRGTPGDNRFGGEIAKKDGSRGKPRGGRRWDDGLSWVSSPPKRY